MTTRKAACLKEYIWTNHEKGEHFSDRACKCFECLNVLCFELCLSP